MNIKELFRLSLWSEQYIEKPNISALYDALHNKLNLNAQPNRAKEPFEPEKNSLYQQLESIPLSQLTEQQREFLKSIKILQCIGDSGKNAVEEILVRNPIDPATAAAHLLQIRNQLNEGIEKIKKIREGLIDVVVPPERPADETLVRLKFSNEASIHNVIDLKRWANSWAEIARGIAMFVDQTPEDVRIIGGDTGSFILELSANQIIATILSNVVIATLKHAVKTNEFKHYIERLKRFGISDDNRKGLDQEYENALKRAEDDVLQTVVKESGRDLRGQGDTETALRTAIKDVLKFMREGGEIDMIPPASDPESNPDKDNDEDRNALLELKAKAEEIRGLTYEVRQLPAPKDDDADE